MLGVIYESHMRQHGEESRMLAIMENEQHIGANCHGNWTRWVKRKPRPIPETHPLHYHGIDRKSCQLVANNNNTAACKEFNLPARFGHIDHGYIRIGLLLHCFTNIKLHNGYWVQSCCLNRCLLVDKSHPEWLIHACGHRLIICWKINKKQLWNVGWSGLVR